MYTLPDRGFESGKAQDSAVTAKTEGTELKTRAAEFFLRSDEFSETENQKKIRHERKPYRLDF